MFSTSVGRCLTSAALLPLRNGTEPQGFNAFQGTWLNPSSDFKQEALLTLESIKVQLHDLSNDRKTQSLNTSPGIQCLQLSTRMRNRSAVLPPGLVSVSPSEERDAVLQLATDRGLSLQNHQRSALVHQVYPAKALWSNPLDRYSLGNNLLLTHPSLGASSWGEWRSPLASRRASVPASSLGT